MTPVHRWDLVAAVAVLLVFAPATAKDRRSPLSGVFSNISLSPETGDLGGLEIEFHPEAPAPYAFVVFCEGWCNQAHRVPVNLDGSRFSLSFSETYFDASGEPAGEDRYDLHGRLVGGELIVDLRTEAFQSRVVLKPLETRFGLAVARAPGGHGDGVPRD